MTNSDIHKRYAVYLCAEPQTDLARWASAWLGWDIHKALPNSDRTDVAKFTERPRKYGFHGTLVAPFVAKEGVELSEISRIVDQHCRELGVFQLSLHLNTLGKFLALTADADEQETRAVSSALVRALNHLRADLSDADLKRRMKPNLTDQERKNVQTWGYPYVFDAFRFHMTLTGPLKPSEQASVFGMLDRELASLLAHPLEVNAIYICGERPDGFFETLSRHELSA